MKTFLFLLTVASVLGGTSQNRTRDPNKAEAIPIVVSPSGFSETSFELPAGSYVFVVLNRTGFDDITVYLERMPANNITDTPAAQEFGDTVGASRVRLVKNAKLTPGTYRLRVANRPAWICAIRVN